MRHEFPVLPVRIQETTSVATRVVHRTAQAILARVRTQHVITLHAEWFIHCRHLASCGGGLEEHGGEILLLRRPPRFEVELRAEVLRLFKTLEVVLGNGGGVVAVSPSCNVKAPVSCARTRGVTYCWAPCRSEHAGSDSCK